MARISRPELNGAAWRRSSYSNQEGGDCVEVADGFQEAVVPVRDSKVPHGPALCIEDDDATFVNIDAANEYRSPSTDLTPHRCQHDKLQSVELALAI